MNRPCIITQVWHGGSIRFELGASPNMPLISTGPVAHRVTINEFDNMLGADDRVEEAIYRALYELKDLPPHTIVSGLGTAYATACAAMYQGVSQDALKQELDRFLDILNKLNEEKA